MTSPTPSPVDTHASGILRWNLNGQDYTGVAFFEWTEQQSSWFMKGSVGSPFTPDYQSIRVRLPAMRSDDVIRKRFEPGDAGYYSRYARMLPGGLWDQGMRGGANVDIDWNNRKLSIEFDGQIQIELEGALLAVSGTFTGTDLVPLLAMEATPPAQA
ncbi:hypothetical protein [Pseudomonas baltica]|uniref:hypothetical protein n=1 Tax=Pseudomonas baltica TaxID=2762576 RepID=UPI002899454E|nr:hypothetical protein [Pseudomonas baltica]